MLKVEHLKKHYKDFDLDCSFSVAPGTVTGLIGRNGAGKSTAYKAILGLISKDAGTVEIMGKPIENFTEKDRQKLGVVLADSFFSEYLNIRDITEILKATYQGFEPEKFLQRCKEFGLPLEKTIREFSTGMKAKIKLLTAVSHKANLLILDEPTLGLDVIARDELFDILRDYMEEDMNRSVLISSHISSDLENICDTIYMIEDGTIIFHEDTDVLLSDYGILKLTKEQFKQIDKEYIIKYKTEPFGVSCLTNQKQYYMENFPEIVVEKGDIDHVIAIMAKGEKVC